VMIAALPFSLFPIDETPRLYDLHTAGKASSSLLDKGQQSLDL